MAYVRYSGNDCKEHAKFLAQTLGKKFGDCWEKKDGEYKAIIGCWDVDYNQIYGGCVITEIANEDGATTHPFGMERLPPRQFVKAVNYAATAIDLYRKEYGWKTVWNPIRK